MIYYNSVGPNPKVVRMFMAELGTEIETVEVDLVGGENREAAYMKKNPAGQCPALALDNGEVLTEITAICEYLDDLAGHTDLIGKDAEARGMARMWARRIDLNINEPLTNGFRFSEGLALFKDRVRTMPEAADELKLLAQERISWLNGLMAGKTFVCGDRFTLADILLFCFLEFGAQVGQAIDEKNEHIVAWYKRIQLRSSASA